MQKLNHDWLTEGLMDFEYKKYILLAYLRDIKDKFNKTQLYPFLSELIFHYNNLRKIKDRKEVIYKSFPKTISKADFKKLKLSYNILVNDDETIRLMEEIISYAMPQIDRTINEGKELYEFVKENIEFETVGVKPLYDQEGYLFFNKDASRDVTIYRYSVTVFESSTENYRGISTTFLMTDFRDLSRSFETIKVDLVKRFKDLPNPNTFAIISKMAFPMPETLLPIAKRLVMREVSAS